MRYTVLLLILLTTYSYGQTPCVNGSAAGYPCQGYDLQSMIPFTDMGASNTNDSWGWTDPLDGKEYVLVGLDNGTGFIDISEPTSPIYLGKLPTATGSSVARDIKTYSNTAYVVSDNNGSHGMQVFDLTRLRNVTNPPEIFTMDAHYTNFQNAHNLAINEETGFAYALRTDTFGGGIHFIDLQDPLNPVAAGGFSGVYTHDAQIVNYNGPDSDYAGREILLSFNGYDQDVWIVDVTDKSNPQAITNFNYSSNEHAHQGWFTDDQRYLIMGDEADELSFGFNTRTIIFDLTDLDNPIESFQFFGNTSASDHNGYTLGDTFYLANYAAGMRVMDISDIENGNMTETGYFDVFPSNNTSGFNGAWTVYPYFESGNIVISSLGGGGGFFLVKESDLSVDQNELNNLVSIYPNPTTHYLNLELDENLILSSVNFYDITGRLVKEVQSYDTIDLSNLQSGIFLIEIDTDQGIVTKKILKE